MANTLLYNLAAMTVASTGTGTITLGTAARINGVLFLSFASAGVNNGDIVAYSILDPSGASEVGFGTYTSSGTTLTRNPTTSTNANAAINMSAASIVRISPRLQDIGTPGQRPGTNTNDSAAAGNVGESIFPTISIPSAITLATTVTSNIIAQTIGAGDWEIGGIVYFQGAGSPIISAAEADITITSGTSPFNIGQANQIVPASPLTVIQGVVVPPSPFSFSVTSSIFLTALASFTGGTSVKAFGALHARRAR